MRFALSFLVLVSALCARSSDAQDLESALGSLSGVGVFVVDATVEGPAHLASAEALTAETLTETARRRLRSAGLPVGEAREGIPNLHLHLNMMQIENGLIAFSAELDFIQDVVLTRNRRSLRAATWNESVVGLVSHDMTPVIAESVDGLIDQFAQDFQSAN